MEIGNKVRSLRKSKKMTLRKLSEATGIALATLSRIETNKMIGTIKSHQAICSALGISFAELYDTVHTPDKAVEFQSVKNRTDVFLHNDKSSYFMLTNNILSKKMMPVIIKLAGKGASVPEELPKNTERFIYILKGECRISVGTDTFSLKKGETLYFDASINHCFENTGHEEAQVISVITPPVL